MLILGIDPGTLRIGYGLVRGDRGRFQAIDHGVVQAKKELPFPDRLFHIFHAVSDLLERERPDAMAVEEVYVTSNAKTTLRLGHARGVILLAGVEKRIPMAEYAPREVKQAVVGSGAASKEQVQWMMRQILGLGSVTISEDASDALAVALCHGLRSQNGFRNAAGLNKPSRLKANPPIARSGERKIGS